MSRLPRLGQQLPFHRRSWSAAHVPACRAGSLPTQSRRLKPAAAPAPSLRFVRKGRRQPTGRRDAPYAMKGGASPGRGRTAARRPRRASARAQGGRSLGFARAGGYPRAMCLTRPLDWCFRRRLLDAMASGGCRGVGARCSGGLRGTGRRRRRRRDARRCWPASRLDSQPHRRWVRARACEATSGGRVERENGELNVAYVWSDVRRLQRPREAIKQFGRCD
jgi:hypothetical protein